MSRAGPLTLSPGEIAEGMIPLNYMAQQDRSGLHHGPDSLVFKGHVVVGVQAVMEKKPRL